MYASVERLDEERDQTMDMVYRDMKQPPDEKSWIYDTQGKFDEIWMTELDHNSQGNKNLSQSIPKIPQNLRKNDQTNRLNLGPDLDFIKRVQGFNSVLHEVDLDSDLQN